MARFTDSCGRTWIIEIHVPAIKRVQALTDVNLLTIVEGELIERLSNDPVVLVDVLYACCKPQADRDGVTDEDFGAAMVGDVISDATAALLAGLVDFLPESKRRLVQKAAAKYQTMQALAMDLISERLDDPKMESNAIAELENALRQPTSSAATTGSPGSSERIHYD